MVGANSNEKTKFEEQALKDWESILLSRSEELSKGGRFVCLSFGIDEEGQYLDTLKVIQCLINSHIIGNLY